jgi:serine/threonine protein kinase
VKSLLEGLEYLHQKLRVVHGNLLPENIVFDENGELKLIDF